MDVKGKYVLVFGAGKSAIGAAGLLLHEQAKVILYDGNAKQDPEEIRRKLNAGADVEIILGELSDEVLDRLELVVLSPGVPADLPVVLKMKEKEIPVWG